MKQNIFKQGLTKTCSWVATHTAWMTMVFSPIAQGQQAENLVKQYKANMQTLGMNKKQTVKEFWDKVKADVPGYAYHEFEAAVNSNPNALMPEFQFKTSKASDGTEIPVLTFTENGKTHNVQIYGERAKFMKFDNTTLTEAEAKQPAVMFQKLMDNDKNLKQRYSTEMNKPVASSKAEKFKYFSKMDKATWQKMTPTQRVTFFVQMRLMYMDAKKVIQASKESKGKKSASLEKLESIYKALFPDVEAQVVNLSDLQPAEKKMIGTSSNKTKVTVANGKTVSIPYDAQSCIVAGYVGKYVAARTNGKVHPHCSVDVAIGTYGQNEKTELGYVKTANEKCVTANGANSVACNPIIYGYPKGSPVCVDREAKSFQVATHWDGPCDSASRLTSSSVAAFEGKDYSRISPRAVQIDAIKADQAKDGFKLSKDFIDGVLQSKDATLAALFQKGEWSESLESEIKRIGSQFDTEIDQAIALCEKDITAKHEKNQKGACDQLHGTFVEEVLKGLVCPSGFEKNAEGKCVKAAEVTPVSACPEGSKAEVNPEWCVCKDAQGNDKSFKASEHPKLPLFCAVPTDGETCDPEQPDACAKNCATDYPPLSNLESRNGQCYCPGTDNVPKEDQPGFLAKLFNNQKQKDFKAGKRQYTCKFGPNWWAVGGIAAGVIGVGVLAYFIGKGKTKTVTNTVTNTETVIVDNTFTCKAPKYAVPINSLATSVSSASSLLSGASASLSADSTTRQAAKYKCVCPPCPVYYLANGQSVNVSPNAVTCACTPPPNEGGSGNNPSDDDSGGVPGNTTK